MSLKAKIEAVIYASEEPVTLSQLVGLLGEEAQAELDRVAAAQATLALNDAEVATEAEPVEIAGADPEPEAEAEAAAESTSEDPDLEEPATESESLPEDSLATEPTHGDEPAMNGAPDFVAESTSEDAEVEEPVAEAEVLPEDSVATEPTHGDEPAMNGAPEFVAGEPTSENPDVGHPDIEAAEAEAADSVEADAATAAAVVRAERARATKLRAYFREVLDGLVAEYAKGDRGLEVREVAGGFRFATKPEYHDAVRGFVKSLKPPLKLTLQALETLAVVAYKQPVTAPEISEIRGVDSSGVLGSLIARKLISTAGRKQVIGRPILYKTTREFLLKFGLKDTAELPSIEEFERMAGQMAEQEDIPMVVEEGVKERAPETAAETAAELGPETEAYVPHEETGGAPADDVVDAGDKASVDGRLPSLPPNYAADEADDPSAQEAEIQSGEES